MAQLQISLSSCMVPNQKHRKQFLHKLAVTCEEMCKKYSNKLQGMVQPRIASVMMMLSMQASCVEIPQLAIYEEMCKVLNPWPPTPRLVSAPVLMTLRLWLTWHEFLEHMSNLEAGEVPKKKVGFKEPSAHQLKDSSRTARPEPPPAGSGQACEHVQGDWQGLLTPGRELAEVQAAIEELLVFDNLEQAQHRQLQALLRREDELENL